MKFILTLFCIFASVAVRADDEKALVSVAPYVTMVHELAPDVGVQLLVPAGFSSHTYEPTPKQVLEASKAKIWFIVGEFFEEKIIKAIKSQNSQIAIVDLREGLELIDEECHGHHHHHGAADPHIWMSPKMMQVEVRHMARSLQTLFPQKKEEIIENCNKLIARLQALDDEIRALLAKKVGSIIFVSHPAYGYFCKEYGLQQKAIEFEGKDPTPKQIAKIVDLMKEKKVKTIFAQKQYSTKASELIANEIGAKVVMLDPYAENYFDSMRTIAKSIAQENES